MDDPSDRVPYRFSYAPPKTSGPTTNPAIDIENSIYHDLLAPGTITVESLLVLSYTPQFVFRVRAVTRCTASISGHGQPILCVAFPPNTSTRMASGSGDGTARIWDCETGTPFKTLKGHTSWVLAVAYSPDGALLATGSMDNTIRIWDSASGDSKAGPLKGHVKWITALAWEPFHLQSPGRPRVASSSKDGTIRVWDTVSGRCDLTLAAHKGTASCVRWGGTGYIYTCGHDKQVRIWDSQKGTCIKSLGSHAHWVNHLSLSTGFALRTSFFDPQSAPPSDAEKRGVARRRFERTAAKNGTLDERFATASDDCTMYLWSTAALTSGNNKPMARLTGHQKQINHVAFSPSGDLLASCGFDGHVKLWRGSDGKFLRTLRGHVAAVYQCAFSSDGRLLVSCSRDSTVKVWDMAKGTLKEDLPGHRDEVYAADWSPGGERVGSAGRDKIVKIWGR